MKHTQPSAMSTKVKKGELDIAWGGLTGAERVVGSLELFTRSKVLALGRDALEVIRVVLEAVRGFRCAPHRRRMHVPVF